jgi:hypothetical protein
MPENFPSYAYKPMKIRDGKYNFEKYINVFTLLMSICMTCLEFNQWTLRAEQCIVPLKDIHNQGTFHEASALQVN